MRPKSNNYLAYLLRLWRENENAPWRASLENPSTGERTSFASLDRLVSYLKVQTDGEAGADKEVDPTE